MSNEMLAPLGAEEIDQVVGGNGCCPPEPTFEDLIELAEKIDEATRWRLGIGG